ncbi:hypothetical protein GCM10010151_00500 [Actinoallomurus spadix]|uniref:Uncharacterized protein n=1 Tax=Actinoallomurus spadix TaxID=79912 RepID=A0ABN0VPW2_9ACTN
MADGGDEVGQGFPGAGARLHGEVLARLDGVRDGLGHLDLPRPLGAADAGDRRGEKGSDAGDVGLFRGVEEVFGHPVNATGRW